MKCHKLRVLQLCHDYQGPFQFVCREYAQAFVDADVTTVYLKGSPSEDVIRKTGGNRVLFFQQPHLRGFKWRGILALARLLRHNDYDVVIAHRYKPIYLAGILSYFFDIRLILGVVHEHDVFRRMARSLFVSFWRKNISIIAVSDSVFRNIADQCPALASHNRLFKLLLALPEIDLMDRGTARQELKLPDGFLFGCVGRLVKKKKHELLIQAFARAELGEDCSLVFCGTGILEQQLQELAGSLGMGNRIVFKGQVDHAARYFRAFDAFVLPSGNEEAFGVVLLEAMQAGLPILASEAPGPGEVLGDVGIRFTVDDVDDLASSLQWLYQQDERRRLTIGQQAKHRFNSKFTTKNFTKNFHNLPPIHHLHTPPKPRHTKPHTKPRHRP